MRCKYPTVFDRRFPDAPQPCGQCLHCRINKRRTWAHRIVLESLNHTSNSFVTLTYRPEDMPGEFMHPETGQIFAAGSVNPWHHETFMKDLRYHFMKETGKTVRFYAIGEYGDKLERPHYHYALFGFPRCSDGARYVGHRFIPCGCPSCKFLSDRWQKGNIFAGDLTLESASYIAEYVNKKLTTASDYRQDGYYGLTNAQKLRGRHPEFPRMSTRPGIAAWAADSAASQLAFYKKLGDIEIPHAFNHAGKSLPLGRYLSDRIHAKMGYQFEEGERIRAYAQSLRSLLSSPETRKSLPQGYLGSSVASKLTFLNSQYSVDLAAKTQLFTKAHRI